MADPNHARLSAMFFHVWKTGQKGCYYLRSRPAASAVKTTVPVEMEAKAEAEADAAALCRRDNPEGCLMCSA